MSRDRITGFIDGIFDCIANMSPIASCDHLHDVVDCQFCGHLTGAMANNTGILSFLSKTNDATA
jgi:hypothetical protein